MRLAYNPKSHKVQFGRVSAASAVREMNVPGLYTVGADALVGADAASVVWPIGGFKHLPTLKVRA